MLQSSVDAAVVAINSARAGKFYQRHFLGFTRLEARCRACRNVEPFSVCRAPVEVEGIVHFVEMEVAAHLNRPVARIRHQQRKGSTAGVGENVARL